MIQFQCDYNEGCHPAILDALVRTNMEQTVGYGEDEYCDKARKAIRDVIGRQDADVHFLVGGTQANTTVIASILRPYQGVLAADTGHINVHETGAIEATGHKVLAIRNTDGKLTADDIEKAVINHQQEDGPEHMVQPGMVYISFSTEIGTIYSKQELSTISSVCHKYHLPLFIDGARLGYGLCSPDNDVNIQDIAKYADVFYIGGTKVGALFGEAVVILNPALKQDFRYSIKQRGGMLAKGRLLGIQFLTLFTDNLYFKISQHAIDLAMKIRDALKENGIAFYADSPTNQQFPILSNDIIERLSKDFLLSPWAKVDENHMAMRICTSWATTEENVDKLLEALCDNNK